MIKPTIGRVVWYYHNGPTNEQPRAALVAYVHSDRMVNLGYFDSNGIAGNATSVRLVQPEDENQTPAGPFCAWMPYQTGQAAKTEAVEKKLAEKSAA